MAVIKNLDSSCFDETIANGTVLVDFWAPWCGPCKMLGTMLEQIASTAPADVVIAKVNVDENAELAAKYEVTNLPHVFIYKNGQVVNEFTGMVSKNKILSLITE